MLEVSFKKKDKPQEMRVFLFNDLILITREHKKTLEYRRSLHLEHSKITNLADMFAADSFSWEMRDTKKKETTNFYAHSHSEKVTWMKSIQKLIKEYQREQFASMYPKLFRSYP